MKKTFLAQHPYSGEFHLFHLLKQTVLETDYFDGSKTVLYRVVAPRDINPRIVRRCLSDTFTRGGCGHDYDCCGCFFSSAYPIKQISKREWLVWEHISYNY